MWSRFVCTSLVRPDMLSTLRHNHNLAWQSKGDERSQTTLGPHFIAKMTHQYYKLRCWDKVVVTPPNIDTGYWWDKILEPKWPTCNTNYIPKEYVLGCHVTHMGRYGREVWQKLLESFSKLWQYIFCIQKKFHYASLWKPFVSATMW